MQTCHFGTFLRQARLEKGLTQQRLAAKLQITQQMLSAIERGCRRCHEDIAARAVDVLGVPSLRARYCLECPFNCNGLGVA
ncbi:hypothetical protein kuro4_01080 [Gelria sp. Kuro-4]|nr:hypothetical protein kuro4_01080 [Gelria sp. Kuro-4]